MSEQMAFLEPVYLNEKMVLNCAAYLWKGVSLEDETSSSTKNTASGGLKAGMPLFLQNLLRLNVEGAAERVTNAETKSVRRYTVGGLHMDVLEELKKRQMLNLILPENIDGLNASTASYIDVIAVLRPTDFQSLLSTLRVIGPLAMELLRDYGTKIIPAPVGQKTNPKMYEFQENAAKYRASLEKVTERLEADYQTSKQLEMLMVDEKSARAFGVVDIDVADSTPAEISAKLTDGRFHIVGKVARKIRAGESMNLMQRTALSSLVLLANRAVSARDDATALVKYNTAIAKVQSDIEKFLILNLRGPAIRITAMSVCI